MRRRVLALVAASLLWVPPPAEADDVGLYPHGVPDVAMPHVDRGFKVVVRPGEQVRITPGFSADSENCIQVFDQATGRLVAVWHIRRGDRKPWSSPINLGAEARIYLVVGRHKKDGKASEPWALSEKHVLDDGAPAHNTATVGFEDGSDGDFNDTRVAVIWTSPS